MLSEERKRQTDGKGRGVLLFLSLLSYIRFHSPFRYRFFGVLLRSLSCLNLLVSEQRRRRFLRGTSPLRNLASPSTHHIISFWFFFLFISFLFLLRIVLNSLRPIFLFRRDGWRDNTRKQNKNKKKKIILKNNLSSPISSNFFFFSCVCCYLSGIQRKPTVPLLSLSRVCVYINIGKKKNFILPRKIRTKNGRRFVVGHQRHKQHIFSIKISKENFRQFSSSFFLKKRKKNLLSSLSRGQNSPKPHHSSTSLMRGYIVEGCQRSSRATRRNWREKQRPTQTELYIYKIKNEILFLNLFAKRKKGRHIEFARVQ